MRSSHNNESIIIDTITTTNNNNNDLAGDEDNNNLKRRAAAAANDQAVGGGVVQSPTVTSRASIRLNDSSAGGRFFSSSANNSPSVNRRNLVSANGSIIWDSDNDWIQLYDSVLRLGRSRSFRTCGCRHGYRGNSNSNANNTNAGVVGGSSYDGEVDQQSAEVIQVTQTPSISNSHSQQPSTASRPTSAVSRSPSASISSSTPSRSSQSSPSPLSSMSSTTSSTSTAPGMTTVPVSAFKPRLPPPKGQCCLAKRPLGQSAVFLPRLIQSSTSRSGAADEEMFMNAFEDVPRIQLFSGKDLDHELSAIRSTCADPSSDWEKRHEALRRFRSLLLAGAGDFDEFYAHLKSLELPFQISVKDLRSQVVREACITIAYMSTRVGIRLDRFVEALLPTLIGLIQNSAKIMSSSAVVAVRFVIEHTRANRLIPIITFNIGSKSKDIRKACCEFLDQLLHTWPTSTLERHVGVLQEAIKKGISDADPEARAFSRKAFWGFADKFKQEAEFLLTSLDINKQRLLHGEQNGQRQQRPTTGRGVLRAQSFNGQRKGSVEMVNATSQQQRTVVNAMAKAPVTGQRSAVPLRSTSAIDSDAQRRAKARALASAHPKAISSGLSLARQAHATKHQIPTPTATAAATTRTRSKNRMCQSQPGSRSQSPASRLNYYTTSIELDGRRTPVNVRGRRNSGATGMSSRDPSPGRTMVINHVLSESRRQQQHQQRSQPRTRYYSGGDRNQRHLMTAEGFLKNLDNQDQSDVDGILRLTRRRYNSVDGHSDESETSSICSDLSYISFGGRRIEDMSEVIANLSSAHWSDRKEGLLGLAYVLRHSPRPLTGYELKRVTDIFTKMIVDPHTKTLNLFLDILCDLIISYKTELSGWLYVLLTRLFLKIRTDLLGSIQTKIHRTFELIRESFPADDQLSVIIRFLADQTQTPNVKVKTAVLQYLAELIPMMDAGDVGSVNGNELQLALMKMVSWTADPKSLELRKAAQDVIVDLFNLNPAEVSIAINSLSSTYQDAAVQIIQKKRRLASQSPSRPSSSASNRSRPSPEGLKSYEDIYNSLKKTTDEIQNYSFILDEDSGPKSPKKKSNDSSPVARQQTNNNNAKDLDVSNDSGFIQVDGNTSTSSSSPPDRKSLSLVLVNGKSISENTNRLNGFESQSKLSTLLKNLSQDQTDQDMRRAAFDGLTEMIRADALELASRFKDVYRVLLELMSNDNDAWFRAAAIKTLEQLMMAHPRFFDDFIELTVFRILEASKDLDKSVVTAGESAAATAAGVLPPEPSLTVLKSVITNGESPMSVTALRMLSKLIDQQPKQKVVELLPEILPVLIRAYDNTESGVRKTAVFCMVTVHCVVGDLMKPYLSALTGSKLKLLKLYIERAKMQTITTNGPVNGQVNGRTNEQANEQPNNDCSGQINGQHNGQPNGQMNGQMNGQTEDQCHY